MAEKYRLKGTRQRVRSHGSREPFETVVIADSPEDAKELARWNWRDDWHHVHFTSAVAVP